MANLTETPTYEAGIYRFETTDPVQGGPGGIDNLPTNQLANRTAWLKAQVEAILLDIAAIESGYATDADLAGHTGNTSNPHAVTKAQVGLGSVLNYGIATQAEAEAGTIDTKYMTPLRSKQAIAALVPASSETVAGLIERATAEEARGLSDTLRAITPATLAAALKGANQSLSGSGFQKLPGGLLLQWGSATLTQDDQIITFPVSFSSAVYSVQITSNGYIERVTGAALYGSLSGFVAQGYLQGGSDVIGGEFIPAAGTIQIMWFAVGA